jgi:ribosome-binding protein aMBF1 (putative translation factor)
MAKKTRNATEILERLTGDDTELREMIAEETVNAQVARMIYEARTAAGLTQKQLADLVETQRSTIAAWRTPTTKATPCACSDGSQRS